MKGRSAVLWAVVVVVFALCAAHVVRVNLQGGGAADQRKIVRVGHYLLHSGVRDALQEVIDEYENLHLDVHVVQVPVPEQIYLQYLRTQLVSGQAPDILQIGAHFTGMEEMRARYFQPITRWVEQPNPYNAGTVLAGRRWRDTFVDGLDNTEAYSAALREYYGVPLTMPGERIFYNLSLLEEITGHNRLPKTYAELITLCQQVEAYSKREGRPVVPFAGSRMSALFLMAPLVSSVSQRLYYDAIADAHSLHATGWDYGLAYLRGRWDFDQPSIRLGFALTRELARYQKSGFYQLNPADAALQFLQRQSLMITAFVLDVSNLKAQANFPIGMASIPTIARTDPVYGAGVLGPVSELSSKAMANFGIVAHSPHAVEALDFLRFLASKHGMEVFSSRSNWLPSVVEVEVSDWMKPMQPVQEGYAGRFFAEYAGKGDARFVMGNQLHLLIGQGGSVEAFLDMARHDYGPAMRTDLLKDNREAMLNLRRQDAQLFKDYLSQTPGGDETKSYWQDLSSQNGYEANALRVRLILARTAVGSSP